MDQIIRFIGLNLGSWCKYLCEMEAPSLRGRTRCLQIRFTRQHCEQFIGVQHALVLRGVNYLWGEATRD